MGWLNDLARTYDQNQKFVGKKTGLEPVLLPISHSTAKAQIQVAIDIDGNFLSASSVSKNDAVTMIPVTEDSGARSSGIAPHPLCDKLCYVAGDYMIYSPSDKDKSEYYETYIRQLKQWVQSPFSHKKVEAIYNYLVKKSIIGDLAAASIIRLDENHKMTNDKIEGINQADAFIRFSVEDYSHDITEMNVWEDEGLFKSFEDYYMNLKQENDICYSTGECTATSVKHPAKLRNSGDKAKLISSNDTYGYTFRGRFEESQNAVSLGYEASQKAHNALRWLIAKQGYRNDSSYIVSWAIDGTKLPNFFSATDELWGEDEFQDDVNNSDIPDVATEFAIRLNKAIAGYRADLTVSTEIVVLSVDTADGSMQGRLAMPFYTKLTGSEFLNNIKNWHEKCSWIQRYKKDENDRLYTFVGAPSPYDIAVVAYGTEQGGRLAADEKVVKKCIERILPCIVNGSPFPRDILLAAIRNASRPMGMSYYNWNKTLTVTCALLKKCKSQDGEDIRMVLDENIKDRSYHFGRLLAVAEVLERSTYDYESDKNRVTNAMRYQSVFVKRPMSTWTLLYERLVPYLNKKPKSRDYYLNLITGVMGKIAVEDYSDAPLDGMYLAGYFCQYEAMKSKEKAEG